MLGNNISGGYYCALCFDHVIQVSKIFLWMLENIGIDCLGTQLVDKLYRAACVACTRFRFDYDSALDFMKTTSVLDQP